MRRVALFVEDFGHEEFITAWVQRFSRETGVPVDLLPYSVRGGHGRVLQELGQFVQMSMRPVRHGPTSSSWLSMPTVRDTASAAARSKP